MESLIDFMNKAEKMGGPEGIVIKRIGDNKVVAIPEKEED